MKFHIFIHKLYRERKNFRYLICLLDGWHTKIKAFRLFCFAPEKAGYHSGYQSRYPAQYPKRHHDQALFLLNFFAADMFNFYFKKLYSFSRAFDFLIDQLFIRIVFHRNLFQDFRCFCTFFQ